MTLSYMQTTVHRLTVNSVCIQWSNASHEHLRRNAAISPALCHDGLLS